MKPIQTEAEYQQTLERILKGAEMIEHPLTTPEKREQYMKLYDALCEQIQNYHIREYAATFPYMRRTYEEIGLLPMEEKNHE